MAKRKNDDPRRLSIVRSPVYKGWTRALRAYESALSKREDNAIEARAVWRARDKAEDALNFLRALPLSPDELAEEQARLGALKLRGAQVEVTAQQARVAARAAELRELEQLERDDPHTRYVPGVGYVRGKRVFSQ